MRRALFRDINHIPRKDLKAEVERLAERERRLTYGEECLRLQKARAG